LDRLPGLLIIDVSTAALKRTFSLLSRHDQAVAQKPQPDRTGHQIFSFIAFSSALSLL
jgi:hypothetical protein